MHLFPHSIDRCRYRLGTPTAPSPRITSPIWPIPLSPAITRIPMRRPCRCRLVPQTSQLRLPGREPARRRLRTMSAVRTRHQDHKSPKHRVLPLCIPDIPWPPSTTVCLTPSGCPYLDPPASMYVQSARGHVGHSPDFVHSPPTPCPTSSRALRQVGCPPQSPLASTTLAGLHTPARSARHRQSLCRRRRNRARTRRSVLSGSGPPPRNPTAIQRRPSGDGSVTWHR